MPNQSFLRIPIIMGIDAIISKLIKGDPVYDFETDDGVGHHFWIIDDEKDVHAIAQFFERDVPYVYVADGHHRTAAAALVGNERKKNNPAHTGRRSIIIFYR